MVKFGRPNLPPLRQDVLLFAALTLCGIVAANINVQVPHTPVVIEIRWLFLYVGAVLVRRWWLLGLMAVVLSVSTINNIPWWLTLFGNLSYAIPAILLLRVSHDSWLGKQKSPWMYGMGWFALVILIYEALHMPLVPVVLGLYEGNFSVKQVWGFWKEQPFLEEGLLVATLSALLLSLLRETRMLRDRDREYRVLFENMRDGWIETDMIGRFQRSNQAFLDMVGYTQEELRMIDLYALTPSRWHEWERDLIVNRIMKTGYSGIYEKEYIHKDGTVFPIEVTAYLRRDAAGSPVGMWGLTRDITERKEFEEQIREAHNIIDATHAVAFLWRNEPDWPVEFVSANISDLVGYTAQELVSGNIRYSELIHPEDRPRVFAEVETFVPEACQDYFNHEPYRLVRKNGEAIWVENRTAIRVDPERNVTHYEGFLLDITQRIRVEQDLQMQGLVLDQIQDMVLITDLKGNITYANHAEQATLGRTVEELIGRNIQEFGETEEQKEEQRLVIATTLEEGEWQGEIVNVTADHSQVLLNCRTQVVYDQHGKPIALCGISTDITKQRQQEDERRRLDQQMEKTQRLESLGVLAGGIAHDFNNILMAVLGHAELAIDITDDASPVRPNLNEISVGAQRASELCRQMLAYAGKDIMVSETVDLAAMIREMAHLLETSVSKKADLRLNIEDDLPTLYGDPSQIRQVVLNLIINASESLEQNEGIIMVRLETVECDKDALSKGYMADMLDPGTYLQLDVSDTGCGMDQETQDRIFEPFFTTKFTGRGLGLAATLGIIRKHKGTLQVQSAPQRGTTFRILLPVSKRQALAPGTPPKPAEETPATSESGGLVLLADDEASLRKLCTQMLRKLGFEVLIAQDGVDAVTQCKAHRKDLALIILDLTMPRMDGGEALKEIRKIAPEIPAVLASGYSQSTIAERLDGVAFDGFIQKPYTLDSMREVLNQALA